MLTMRLQRVGRRNAPMFRVVVTESRNAADGGKHLEVLGSYNPHANTNQLNTERVQYWLSQGVQPSDTVHNLLVNEKLIEAKKKNVLPKKSPIVKEQTEEEAKAAPAETKEESSDENAAEETAEEPAAEEVKEAGNGEEKEESEEKTPDEAPAQDDTSSEEGEEKKEA